MSWSKADAEAFLNGEKTYEELSTDTGTSQPDETKETSTADDAASTVSVQPTADEPQETETTSTEETTASSATDDSPEKVDTEDKNKKKGKSYTKEQRTQHAFAKEKSRRRAVEAELAEVKEKLKKYEGLTLEHFNNDQEAYNDYKLDRRFDEEKVKRLETEQAELVNEEASETARRRVEACYPDEADQIKYENLIARAETDFESMHSGVGCKTFSQFLLQEKDRAIVSYLQDSENAPKLIRHFIHKPEVAQRIMSMSNPYKKFFELQQLENRMLLHERMSKKADVTPKVEKKVLPNTGKVVQTNTVNSGNEIDWTKPMTKRDAEAYFRKRHEL